MYYQGFRTNKFKNKRTVFGGRLYDSKHESSVAADLEIAKSAVQKKDRVVEIRPQYNIDVYLDKDLKLTLTPNSNKLFRYIADFYVLYADGHDEIIEAKSKITMTPVFRIKWKIVEAILNHKYPNMELRIVM